MMLTRSLTLETITDGFQLKRTSYTERFAVMVGMTPNDKEEVITGSGKSKTFGTVSAITTKTDEG